MEPNNKSDSIVSTEQYSRDTSTNPVIYLVITLAAVCAVFVVAMATVMIHEAWMVSRGATLAIVLGLPSAAAIIYLDLRANCKRRARRANIIRTIGGGK